MLIEYSHAAAIFSDFSIWGHAMPPREKLSALRRAWPMLLKRMLGKAKPAPKFFESTPQALLKPPVLAAWAPE